MPLERVFQKTFTLVKKEPKILLIGVPSLFLAGIVLTDFLFLLRDLIEIGTKKLALDSILAILIPHLFTLLIPILLSLFIQPLLNLAYAHAVLMHERERFNLVRAFSMAKKDYWALFITYLVYIFLLIVGLVVAVLPLALSLLFPPLILITLIYFGVALLFLIFLFLISHLFPAIVAFSHESGFSVIKRAFNVAKDNFWSFLAFLFLLLIIHVGLYVVQSLGALLPYVGGFVWGSVMLFQWAIGVTAATYFVIEYGGESLE